MDQVAPRKTVYRNLTPVERDLVFAFYEKYNGNITQMVLDKETPFKSYSQLHHYTKLYHFKDRLLASRLKMQEDVKARLMEAKMKAVQQAMRILESRNVFVYNRNGMQVFDSDGAPLIVEQLPYYKEIKAAWEIIKTELGEPTTIAKSDMTVSVRPLAKITYNIINEPNRGEGDQNGRHMALEG